MNQNKTIRYSNPHGTLNKWMGKTEIVKNLQIKTLWNSLIYYTVLINPLGYMFCLYLLGR